MSRALPALLALLLALPAGAGAQDHGKDGKKGDAGAPKKEERKRLSEGDEATGLSLELAAGGSWSAASERGKVTVLVFAGAWSPESLDALKRLGDPKGRVGAAGAETLGVLRDATPEAARKAAKERDLAVRIAVDPKRKAYDLLARGGLPWTVVVGRTGKIELSAGGFDEEAVAKKVKALLKP